MSEAFAEPAADDGGAAAATPAEETLEATPVEAAPAAAWSPDDPTFLEAVDSRALDLVDSRLAPLAQMLEQAMADPGQQQQPGQFNPSDLVDEFGNLNPAGLVQLLTQQQQQLASQFDQRLQQIQAPLAARQEAETIAEGEQRLQDILGDDIARNGEFSSKPEADARARSLVRTLADQMFPEIAQRYGATPRAAEVAINRAASTVRELLAEERSAAVAAHVDRNARLAGVTGEPGTAGLSAIEGGRDTPYQPGELARKYGQNARALRSA